MGISTYHLRWGGVADLELAITRRQSKEREGDALG